MKISPISGLSFCLVYVQRHIDYFAIDEIDTNGGRRAVRDLQEPIAQPQVS